MPVISGDSDTKSSRFDERAEAPLGDMPSATAAEAAAEQPPAQEQQESTGENLCGENWMELCFIAGDLGNAYLETFWPIA